MEPAEQYSLTHAKSAVEKADWLAGDHRPEGVIAVSGPRVQPFAEPPMLIDLAPTILAALDAPASIKHTGRVLNEVVGADATTRASEAVGTARTEDSGPTVSTDEAEEMEEHLRGLGYLE
jgi:hypothetical protein